MPKSLKTSPGLFVTFEGTEGAGKSTLIRGLSTLLKEDGHTVVMTREPGGHPLAEKVRELILHDRMAPLTELFLYQAARAEHVTETIRPALNRGAIVLCDRFTDSTLAYQGTARGLDWKQIETLNRIATGGLKPDLTFFIDIDPAEGLRRASDPNRFEAEGVRFQTRVRAGFLKSKRQNPKRWVTLHSGKLPPDVLLNRALQSIRKKLK